MFARRASFSPRDKAKQKSKRVREKGTPTACLFCALWAQAPAAFCLRQNRQDRRSAERRIKFPVKVQLRRTFTPLARAAAARPRPPHPRAPSLALSGQFTLCGREGGIVSGFSGTGNVSRGDSVPPPGSPQARKKTACIHRRPFPQRVGKKSKERKNNERYKQINGRSDCRTLPHGHGPSAQNLHDNHWKASLQASQNNHECSS